MVDLAGDVPFQAADDLAAGFGFGFAPAGVFDGSGVGAHPVGGDSLESVVGLAVATSVEAMPNYLSR